MLEHVVRQTDAKRNNLGAGACLDFDGDEVQRLDIVEAETIGGRAADALARAAERFQHVQRRLAEAALREIARDGGGSRCVG